MVEQATGRNLTEGVIKQQEDSTQAVSQAAEETRADISPDASKADSTIAGSQAEDMVSMQELLAQESASYRDVHRGMVVKGRVVSVTPEGVMVDIGTKLEGLIPFGQLSSKELADPKTYLHPGDVATVYVVRADIPNATIILSKKRAEQEEAWNEIQEFSKNKTPVEVVIAERVKGGLVADIQGIRAFLPASQVDVRRVNDLVPYVGQKFKVRVVELNRRRNRVIISRRSVIEEEQALVKSHTLAQLKPGFVAEGEVVEITEFGAFVNLGGIDGLVHRSELTWGRFRHPSEVVRKGDRVKVEVLDMDLEKERINLSMKSLIPDPWTTVEQRYSIGDRVKGKVTNLTSFGAFVEIAPGLEGLIHVSEMSWTKRIRHPSEVLKKGDEVESVILRIDQANRRLSLGLRQTQPDPWSSLPDRYPPGTIVEGKITGITEFGAFMEVEEGIEGLIHISELAHERVEDPRQVVKKGDVVQAAVLNIDPIEQRASLSRRRALPQPEVDYSAQPQPESFQPPTEGERGGRRKRAKSGGKKRRDAEYYDDYEMETITPATIGDVYADLFADFKLEDEEEKRPENKPGS
ncbi:MAG: 30S ribosomal protein S1 [Deinococcus sp.]|nr:30S ribosomal protein S1 [Deinococcus sp.]